VEELADAVDSRLAPGFKAPIPCCETGLVAPRISPMNMAHAATFAS